MTETTQHPGLRAARRDGVLTPEQADENDEYMREIGGEVLCGDCWCWPEDLPDYPGDEQWQGGDDEVRKPGCHPASADSSNGDDRG